MHTDTASDTKCSCSPVCGRKGCVMFYKGNRCLFCKPARDVLDEVIADFGMDFNVVYEVDVEEESEIAEEAGVIGLPTIQICDRSILGVPDEGSIRDALLQIAMKTCFCG